MCPGPVRDVAEVFCLPPSPSVVLTAFVPNTLLLLLQSSEVAVGLSAFLYLFVYNLPKLGMHEAIFSPL